VKGGKDMRVSEVTRRDIVDGLKVESLSWTGRLEETQFLGRLFDLSAMPSDDGRFSDAAGDIQQHRINNHDWDDDWVFFDSRFDLLHGDDELFLRFLCEMLHPVVRPDSDEVERLRQMFNQLLRADGFEIVEKTRISNRPVFAARQIASPALPVSTLKKAFDKADTSYVSQQITRMESAVEADPALAIGTAKELVETVCKTILTERMVTFTKSTDLPELVKLTVKSLSLTPDDIPEKAAAAQTIRRLLSNLGAITVGVAELRNFYGTGHGKHARVKGLLPRHARLAVGAASTLAMFLIETHEART
jgi:hypothetical protein